MIAEAKPNWTVTGSNFARTWLNRLGPLLGLVLVIAVFAILIGNPERYLSLKNLRTVLAQTVIVGIGAIQNEIVRLGALAVDFKWSHCGARRLSSAICCNAGLYADER